MVPDKTNTILKNRVISLEEKIRTLNTEIMVLKSFINQKIFVIKTMIKKINRLICMQSKQNQWWNKIFARRNLHKKLYYSNITWKQKKIFRICLNWEQQILIATNLKAPIFSIYLWKVYQISNQSSNLITTSGNWKHQKQLWS